MRLIFSVVCAAVVLLFTSGAMVVGQTSGDQAQNDAFRGLAGVMVHVTPFDPRVGLTQDQLARDVDQWIRQADIRTFTREEFPTVKGHPCHQEGQRYVVI